MLKYETGCVTFMFTSPAGIDKEFHRGLARIKANPTLRILLDVTNEMIEGIPVFLRWILTKTCE
jgi:hypothetical protein